MGIKLRSRDSRTFMRPDKLEDLILKKSKKERGYSNWQSAKVIKNFGFSLQRSFLYMKGWEIATHA